MEKGKDQKIVYLVDRDTKNEEDQTRKWGHWYFKFMVRPVCFSGEPLCAEKSLKTFLLDAGSGRKKRKQVGIPY